MAKISVIMPVYNMAEYLDEVLSSWTNQTFKDIEIICVDDASTDASPNILQQWCQKDSRIVYHRFEENKTAWAARKWGIEYTTAEYILFADADDTMASCACEELYAEIQKKPADILHFDANIININNLPEARIKNMQNFVAPYAGELHGEEIFTGCFEKKLYQFSLWNKLFAAELCKKAVANTKDMFLPKAQDKMLYWAIALHAKSYRGLPDKRYYNYYFGRGGTGFNTLNLKQFERYCTMGDTANAMHEHLVACGKEEKYRQIDEKNRADLFKDCFARFQKEINEQDKAKAFDLMVNKWDTAEVISALANAEWYNRYKVAKYLRGAESLKCKKGEPKVVATYYHSCSNGGAQRVMCDLSLLWASMGYELIIFTDAEPSEDDYPLPGSAKRVVLPHYQKIDRNNYQERAKALENALREYHVDVMVYHAWIMSMMLWDELVCKVNGVAFVGHCHNIFSLPILKSYDNTHNAIAPYLLADCVVTLSKVDQYFWKHFNRNVHVTINPFSEGYGSWEQSRALDDKQILWIGRLSSEKRPYDALFIMKKVLAQVPDAHLHIVGSNPSEVYMTNFKKKIDSLGLSDHITMHGFHTEVREFYQKASLFLMTSEYEGFSLTLQESKLAGIPCVMYELPYLTLCEGNRGILPVEANNIQAAANAIVELLQNDEMRHQYALDARAHIEEICAFNFAEKWTEIIGSIGCQQEDTIPEVSHLMVETMLAHHVSCVNQCKKSIGVGSKSIKLPKIVQRGMQCWSDHGLVYTIKLAFTKAKNKVFKIFRKTN